MHGHQTFECLFLFIRGSKFHTVFGEILWEMLLSKGASSRDLVWTISDLFGAENVTETFRESKGHFEAGTNKFQSLDLQQQFFSLRFQCAV